MKVSSFYSTILPALGLFALTAHGAPSSGLTGEGGFAGLVKRVAGSGNVENSNQGASIKKMKIESVLNPMRPTCSGERLKHDCEKTCICEQSKDGVWYLTGCDIGPLPQDVVTRLKLNNTMEVLMPQTGNY